MQPYSSKTKKFTTTSRPPPAPQQHGLKFTSIVAAEAIPSSSIVRAHVHSSCPPAKRSCISCRKLKASCDEIRPCSRCTKHGRECVDRTEAEIEAARSRRTRVSATGAPSRRKRTNIGGQQQHQQIQPIPSLLLASSASSSASSGDGPVKPSIDPATYASSVELTEAASIQLYSAAYLAMAQKVELRDTILKIHAYLESLPEVQISDLVEFHTQVHIMLLQTGESYTMEDLNTFLLGGLTQEMINSPTWTGCPLAVWTKLSTRPMSVQKERALRVSLRAT